MPSSIGISPLTTAHHRVLHGSSVRSFPRFSSGFNLSMVRSHGFGSCICDYRAINPRFHYGCSALGGLTMPHTANSLAHSSIGTPSLFDKLRAPTACKQMVSDTISSPSPGCFSPFPHGTGSLSISNNI